MDFKVQGIVTLQNSSKVCKECPYHGKTGLRGILKGKGRKGHKQNKVAYLLVSS